LGGDIRFRHPAKRLAAGSIQGRLEIIYPFPACICLIEL